LSLNLTSETSSELKYSTVEYTISQEKEIHIDECSMYKSKFDVLVK